MLGGLKRAGRARPKFSGLFGQQLEVEMRKRIDPALSFIAPLFGNLPSHHNALSTSPHAQLRRTYGLIRRATTTISLVQKIGRSTVSIGKCRNKFLKLYDERWHPIARRRCFPLFSPRPAIDDAGTQQ